MDIHLTTFGKVRCHLGDEELADLPHKRTRCALLVYLAVEREATRESLYNLFWSGRDEEKARGSLNQALYELRRELGTDWLDPRPDPLTISPVVRTDAAAFEANADRHDLAGALALYQGDFLGGFSLSHTKEFEFWVDRKRSHYARLHRSMRRRRISELLDTGSVSDALFLARQWAELEPQEDEAQHKLIELLAATGQRAEALRQYESYERVLAADQLQPLEQTVALVASLRAANLDGLTPPRVHLPVSTGSLQSQQTLTDKASPQDQVETQPSRLKTTAGRARGGAKRVGATVSTLRRTHALLVVAAAAVVPLALPQSSELEDALTELSLIPRALGPDGYTGHCASVANENVYKRETEELIDAVRGSAIILSPTFAIAGFAGCRIPATDATLAEYHRFFTTHQTTAVGSYDVKTFMERLRGRRGRPPLDSILLTIGSQAEWQRIVTASDTFTIQITDTVSTADSIFLRLHYHRWSETFRLGTGPEAEYWEFDRPIDWLVSDSSQFRELARADSNQIVLFPTLAGVWNEVSSLTISEASRYLRGRVEERRATIQVFGFEISAALIGWVGPLAVAGLAVLLLIQTQHLTRVVSRVPFSVQEYPWLPLFPGGLSTTLSFLTIVLFPTVAAATLAVVLARSALALSIWAVLAAVVSAFSGIATFMILKQIRQAHSSVAGATRMLQ